MPKELTDEGFIACTDDRCRIVEVHPAHTEPKPNRIDECPRKGCGGAVVMLRKKRAKCVKCGWVGPRDPRKVLQNA